MALRLKGGGPLPEVGDRLVVGTCDIAGAGVRALLGLARADGAPPPAVHELELASLVAPLSRDDADARAVFVPPGADGDVTPAVSLVRLDERLSLLAVSGDPRGGRGAARRGRAGAGGRLRPPAHRRRAARGHGRAPLEVELGGESSDETKARGARGERRLAAEDARRGLGALFPPRAATGARATGVFVPGHRVAVLGSLGDRNPLGDGGGGGARRMRWARRWRGNSASSIVPIVPRTFSKTRTVRRRRRRAVPRGAAVAGKRRRARARGQDVHLVMRGETREDRKAKTEKQIQPIS